MKAAGEKLAVIEAMKMENILKAEQDCKVKKICGCRRKLRRWIRSSSSSDPDFGRFLATTGSSSSKSSPPGGLSLLWQANSVAGKVAAVR